MLRRIASVPSKSAASLVCRRAAAAAAASATPTMMQTRALSSAAFQPTQPLRFFTGLGAIGEGITSGFDNTTPYVHVRESETAALVELEVPRFKPNEVHVDKNVKEGLITISGQRTAAHTENTDFEHMLFGLSQAVSFKRVMSFAPELFDLNNVSWTLEHGVLTVTVPKLPPPEPKKQVEGKAVAAGGESGSAVVKTTPEEFAAVAQARWPPAVRRALTPEGGVEYTCELPPAISADHITLSYYELMRRLTLRVNYQVETRTKNTTQMQSVSYQTTMGMPKGVKAQDISTTYDNGVLKVTVRGEKQPRSTKQNAVPVEVEQ